MRRLAAAALLTACGRADEGEPRALLIVLDGVRTDELTGLAPSPLTGMPGAGWATRTWETFGAEGTVVREALNPGITITAPAHAALVTGRNDPLANFPVSDEGVGWYRPERPTLFEEARAQLALGEGDVVLLGNTELVEPVKASVQPGAEGAAWRMVTGQNGLPAGEDAPVLDAIRTVVDEGPPKLMVVNFHDVDREGHYGDPPDYADGVRILDGLVGDLHDFLEGDGADYASNLLVLVTADHGRHRTYDDEGWRNHGDACVGCRAVPLLVWGGGALEGEVLDAGPYTTLDVAPTLAAHLGVDVPWAQGLPLSPLVEGLGGTVRSGDVDPAVLGDTVAVRRFRDDLEARSAVVVDGDVVSTPGAFAAEEPALAELADGSRVVCFREIELQPNDADEIPWVPRCLRDAGDGWVDIGFVATDAGPLWKPVLLGVGGGLVAVWNHNPNGIGELGAFGDVGVQSAAWDPDAGWTPGPSVASYFPTDVSAVATTGGLVVAFGTSEGGTDARFRRWVNVAREVDGALVLGEPFKLAELLGGDARVERPALVRVGDTLRLAMHGYGDGGRVVAACESADGGATWSTPVALPASGEPLPHLTPGWDGDEVVWAEAGDETRLCRARPGDATATCMGAGAARVDGMVVVPGGVAVSRDAGVGAWETSILTW